MAIVIKGLDSLYKKLQRLDGDTKGALRQAIDKTTLMSEASAKANAPVSGSSQADGSGVGSLRASITRELLISDVSIEGRVFTNAPHSGFVEFGTGPVGAANHAGISPNVSPTYTTRKSWVYPTVIDGEETFRTTSGQPARPYLYPAAVEHKDTLTTLARQELLAAIKRTAGGG